MEQMKTIIVAYDKNYGIGANNDLLWQRDLPADLKHFKDITTGNAIIMGLNTYKSIGRPLPNRQNIVLDSRKEPIDGAEVVDSLQAAYDLVETDKKTFVIGGGQVYALAIDTADRILATEVDAVFDKATIFFPEIDPSEWRETSREKHLADDCNLYNYDFVIYERL
jgi:dihydrofolate reductase